MVAAKEKVEIVNVRGEAALIFRPLDPSPPQAGEGRIQFELFSIYTAFGPPKQTYGVRQSVSGFAKATFATQIMYLFIH